MNNGSYFILSDLGEKLRSSCKKSKHKIKKSRNNKKYLILRHTSIISKMEHVYVVIQVKEKEQRMHVIWEYQSTSRKKGMNTLS